MKKILLLIYFYGIFCSFNLVLSQNIYSTKFTAQLTSLSDESNPHSNNIGFRSSQYGTYEHYILEIALQADNTANFTLLPGNPFSDTIEIPNVNVLAFIPSCPTYISESSELQKFAIINQEWNRIQYKFNNAQFNVNGRGEESKLITNIDIANNCLSKALWEILAFKKEGDANLLYYHGWFNFPNELYDALFQIKNGVSITRFNDYLINYPTNFNPELDINQVRIVKDESNNEFQSYNQSLYPLKSERLTKNKNILHPASANKIDDFLTNDTKFATFTYPGIYSCFDPRSTKLGLLSTPLKITSRNIYSKMNLDDELLYEVQIDFTSSDGLSKSTLQFGGFSLSNIPVLDSLEMHKGYQMPMGIGNHSFYNLATEQDVPNNLNSTYYAFLFNTNSNIIVDSHDVGIDGVLLYRDKNNPSELHILILGFERHAFVGHYSISLEML